MPKTKFQEFLRATSQAGVPQQDHLATAAGVKSCSKLQDLTYGVLMTFFMVIAMELYLTVWLLKSLLKWRFRERIIPCWSLPQGPV